MLGHSVLNPMSPQALAISNLFILTMIVSLGIILIIAGVLTYTSIRFRRRPGQGEPPQTFGITKLEIAWTVAPFLLLVAVFGVTVQAMRLSSPGQISISAAEAHNPHRLTVIGHQWWWQVRYASGVDTANEIHIPVGQRFVVALTSVDVIHSFWVPQCGPKIDLVPGQTNYLWLECDRAGVYNGACSEYCGAGHAWMLLRIIAEPQARFSAWEQAQRRAAPATARLHPPAGYSAREVAAGVRLFQYFPCQSCHNVDGLRSNGAPARAEVAPDLTHFGSRQALAAGRIGNTPAHVTAWLANPDKLKPGVHMPNFQLDQTQLRDLTAFLESLR